MDVEARACLETWLNKVLKSESFDHSADLCPLQPNLMYRKIAHDSIFDSNHT